MIFLEATFRQSSTLNSHVVIHDPIKRFQCELCDVRCARKASLVIHMKKHLGLIPKVPCQICGKLIPKREINKHLRYHTGDKPHVCSICSHGFHRADSLRMHMKIHTGEKPFACQVCDRKFTQKHVLVTHMKTHQ